MLLLYFAVILLQISNLAAIPGATKVEFSFTLVEEKENVTKRIEFEASDITWIQPSGLLIRAKTSTKERWRKVGFIVRRSIVEEKLCILGITTEKFFRMMQTPTFNKVGTCYKGEERIDLSEPVSANPANVIYYDPKRTTHDSYGAFDDGTKRNEVRPVDRYVGYGYVYVEAQLMILNPNLTYEDVAAGKY